MPVHESLSLEEENRDPLRNVDGDPLVPQPMPDADGQRQLAECGYDGRVIREDRQLVVAGMLSGCSRTG